jgi:shikimate dehydrogenase
MKDAMDLPRTSGDHSFRAWENGRTVLVGLLGRGIQLSRTPAMHEEEARALGIPCVYRLLDADRMGPPQPELSELLRYALDFGFTGLNVTFPFKQEVMSLLDELSPSAVEVGAVNTVVFKNGRRFGDNTDVYGFRESFLQAMGHAAKNKVLLLGAGGAGTAVAHALLHCGVAQLLVADTDGVKSSELVDRLRSRFGAGRAQAASNLADAAAQAEGIVNATPVGMAKMPGSPLSLDLVEKRHWVADIIYVPLETQLLRHARSLGCLTLTGEAMAVYQAVSAFQLFTGVEPDIDRMKAVFEAFDRTAPGADVHRTISKQGGMS